MNTKQNRQWRIQTRPFGFIKESDFALTKEPVPALDDGQILVRNIYLTLDPGLTHIISEDGSILPRASLGAVIPGFCVGVVEETRRYDFCAGDLVYGLLGWQDYFIGNGEGLANIPKEPPIPLKAHLAVFSLHIGMTAYFGLLDVGNPEAGETLVVSSAAGGVGSLVGQIGKIMGCRVVGIAGSDQKCSWIRDELGFDAAINYKTAPIIDGLRAQCPDGIDVYFDNVGGDALDAVLTLINMKARIVSCGVISQYNATEPVPGMTNFINLHFKRGSIEGFICMDYLERADEAIVDLGKWFAEGKIKYRTDIVAGLENAVGVFNMLFDGSATGKLMIKVSEEP